MKKTKSLIRNSLETILSFVMIVFFAISLSACSPAKKNLPNEISQDDWNSYRQYVSLSTGIKMSYVEMGDPNGEVVILQHGMTDNSRSWSLAAPYFAKSGYHVYIPDLRGMGKSDAPDGYYTTITYATDMEAFFDAKNIDKAIVIGHSLGSFTVQTFALMFPERCSKVVLVSSIPVKQYQTQSLKLLYDTYIKPLGEYEHPSDDFMDYWYDCTFKENNADEVEFDKCIAGLKAESKALAKNTWKNILLGLAATDLSGFYSEKSKESKFDTSIPVLLLHGNDDTMTTNEYQDELKAFLNINANSYINYDNVGHNIQFEIPNRCSNDILAWLENGALPSQE